MAMGKKTFGSTMPARSVVSGVSVDSIGARDPAGSVASGELRGSRVNPFDGRSVTMVYEKSI